MTEKYPLFIFLILALLKYTTDASYSKHILIAEGEEECFNDTCGVIFDPNTPLVKCSYLPDEFITCQKPKDHNGNKSASQELGYGCTKWGGQRFEDVEQTRILCEALPYIECYGDRQFLSNNLYPCVKYSGHYFLTTLTYSVLLGFLGMDRFCLGHTGSAVGKLLTLGGFGVWWIVDVILLVTGELRPEDNSNWVPFY